MNCPEIERLEGYLLGTLDRGSNDAIDEHLELCTTCLTTVETLDATATPAFSSLRGGPMRSPEFEGPAFRELVEKVKSLGSQAPSAALAEGPIAAGTVLGNYVVGEPIAAGGMGRVYKAEHRLMKRVVALKVLPTELFRAPNARARFRREFEAAARLTSPNIVAAYDAGESEGRDFLVMEYAQGRTLADRVRSDGPLPVRRALDCILQTARGLEHAHAAGIVHRDIKPANLIVTDAGQVKILDMGLARIQQALGVDSRDLTSAHVVMGTAAYMAPEQAVDTRQADARADLYSLGCTLFYLLTGQAPYEANTAMGTLVAHREQPIPSLRTTRPDCPAVVEALFRSLVAKDPAERPASAAAVRVELERILDSLADRNLPTKRRTSWRLAGAAAMVVSVLAFAIYVLRIQSPPHPTENSAPIIAASLTEDPTVVKPTPPVTLIDMVLIKPGEFSIGATPADRDAGADEKPQRRIKITRGFRLGKTKVTQAQYRTVMGVNPSIFSPGGRFKTLVEGRDTGDYPVDSLRWLDAIDFCNKLSQREGLPPYYQAKDDNVTVLGGVGYRLPTEAEWEFASRAGTTTIWSFGDDSAQLPEYAWFEANSEGTTHPVALKKPNPLGLFDMYGNVPEWCWDRYDPTYYQRMPLSDPPGSGQGSSRIYRGGGWNVAAAQTRASARDSLGITYGVLTVVGMRVARNVEP